jgi:hypothetical protein
MISATALIAVIARKAAKKNQGDSGEGSVTHTIRIAIPPMAIPSSPLSNAL